MPTYSIDKEDLNECYEDDPDAKEQLKAEFDHETDDTLWTYEAASCALSPEQLSATARLVLQQLREVGVTQLGVRYDGGSDEGFAHFGEAKTLTGLQSRAQLVDHLKEGSLGEKRERNAYFFPPEHQAQLSRADWTKDAFELLAFELAALLLGQGFGTGEFSIEGRFIADLQTNTLTDIPPTENE